MNFAEELKLGDLETKPLSSIRNRATFGVIEEEAEIFFGVIMIPNIYWTHLCVNDCVKHNG